MNRLLATSLAAVFVAATVMSPVAAASLPGPQIIERAQSWTQAGVGYNAGGTYTNQYGTYRTDCSGFVSMALGLPTSYTTGTMLDVTYPIAKDGLEPGDLLLNPAEGAAGHVALFAGWADAAQTRYFAYEQSPSGGAHVSEIPFPYWPGYGTFTPRRYIGVNSTSGQPVVPTVPESNATQGPAPLRDGDFIRHNGQVYRMAGDAPVTVTSWRSVGGRQPTRRLSDDEFAALGTHPADGTLLRTAKPPLGRAETFVVVGGAPVFIPDPEDGLLVVKVDQAAIDQAGQGGAFDRLNDQPADGVMVRTEQGHRYVFAGGAPLPVTDEWFQALRPRPVVTLVPQVTLDQAGGLNAWSHVRYLPADHTVVKVGSQAYQIEGGVPIQHTGVRGVPVDPAALANAGGSGRWAHLVAP